MEVILVPAEPLLVVWSDVLLPSFGFLPLQGPLLHNTWFCYGAEDQSSAFQHLECPRTALSHLCGQI